jgi:hypothetical protein
MPSQKQNAAQQHDMSKMSHEICQTWIIRLLKQRILIDQWVM